MKDGFFDLLDAPGCLIRRAQQQHVAPWTDCGACDLHRSFRLAGPRASARRRRGMITSKCVLGRG